MIEVTHYIKYIQKEEEGYLLGIDENTKNFFLENVRTGERRIYSQEYQKILKEKYLPKKETLEEKQLKKIKQRLSLIIIILILGSCVQKAEESMNMEYEYEQMLDTPQNLTLKK